MKITKCDRCGKTATPKNKGFVSRFLGRVDKYSYLGQEMDPETVNRDLCAACQDELDGMVNTFMDREEE